MSRDSLLGKSKTRAGHGGCWLDLGYIVPVFLSCSCYDTGGGGGGGGGGGVYKVFRSPDLT